MSEKQKVSDYDLEQLKLKQASIILFILGISAINEVLSAIFEDNIRKEQKK